MNENEKFTEIALENGIFETRTTKKYSKRKLYRKNPRIIRAVIPGVIAEIHAIAGKPVPSGRESYDSGSHENAQSGYGSPAWDR